jgi:hypothetical protein
MEGGKSRQSQGIVQEMEGQEQSGTGYLYAGKAPNLLVYEDLRQGQIPPE